MGSTQYLEPTTTNNSVLSRHTPLTGLLHVPHLSPGDVPDAAVDDDDVRRRPLHQLQQVGHVVAVDARAEHEADADGAVRTSVLAHLAEVAAAARRLGPLNQRVAHVALLQLVQPAVS